MGAICLLLAAAHMVGDYIVQNDWMAANKFRDWKARTVHVLAYTACFVPVLLLSHLHAREVVGFLFLLFVMHWITDCRRWASGEKWGPKPILVDQALHAVQIAFLAYGYGL